MPTKGDKILKVRRNKPAELFIFTMRNLELSVLIVLASMYLPHPCSDFGQRKSFFIF
jgi:hypothetical protein